jgi:putative hydrolase of the HAD superfamily
MTMKVRAIVFDWGDTLMRDFLQFDGPMADWPHAEAIEGIEDALPHLHEKYICCVASNEGYSDAELMGRALERVDIRRYFMYLFTSKELGARKPSPVFFTQIIRRIGVSGMECIFVGNDYSKDIVPAKEAGMQTILFSKERRGFTPCADVVIESMRDLGSAVEILARKSLDEFPCPKG